MPDPTVTFIASGETGVQTTSFAEQLVAERKLLVSLLPTYGISALRNEITAAGGATVDEADGEGVITLPAAGAASLTCDTQRRFSYLAGREGQIGVALRMETAPTGNQSVEWGGGDSNNGFFFGRDATSFFLLDRKGAGDLRRINQSEWNVDKLDGTGPSGIDLEALLPTGVIFQIEYTWYGYGPVEWSILTTNGDTAQQRKYVAHRQASSQFAGPTLEDPQVPIRIKAENGGTATGLVVYFGGRQYSLLGEGNPPTRPGSVYNAVATVGTTLTPICSFRRQPTFRGRPNSVPIRATGIELLTTGNTRYQLRWAGTLGGSGPTWLDPADVPVDETAAEVDVASTTIAGGLKIYEGLAASGGGRGAASKDEVNAIEIPVPGFAPVTLLAAALSGTVDVNAILRWEEDW